MDLNKYQKKDSTWIGFQEAQKSINALKQEVEIAEKKLLNAKRSFLKETKLKSPVIPEESNSTVKPISSTKKKVVSPFTQKTVPVHPRTIKFTDENITVPKELYLFNPEEEPNIIPTKLPRTEPPDLQHNLNDFLSKFSSENSSTTSDIKCSSEGTSSLIASTFKNANGLIKRHDVKVTDTSSDTSVSIRESQTQNQSSVNEVIQVNLPEKSFPKVAACGIEWRLVAGKKPLILHSRFKPDGLQKLKDVIENQKQKHEMYQMQLEKQLLSNCEPSEFSAGEAVDGESQVMPLPLRKVCHVKSYPAYKGFNAPYKCSNGTRWRSQKNKFTIAKTPHTKNSVNPPKRIKKIVQCESDFISASHWKESAKLKQIDVKKNPVIETKDDNHKTLTDSKDSSKEKFEDKESSHVSRDAEEKKELHENILTEVRMQSIASKENLPTSEEDSDDNSLDDANTESLPNEDSTKLQQSEIIGDDANSLKENTKPLKRMKRKAKKPPEEKAPSPKIRHYDVDKVRDYIKKKKEERRKRHQDEHRKEVNQVEKKKENLEKLYKYQKSVAKTKPLSPIKTIQQKNSTGREHENHHIEDASTIEGSKDSTSQKLNRVREKEALPSDVGNNLKKNHQEGLQNDAERNTIHLQEISKRKQENLHIDITIPKFISEHSTIPSSVQMLKPSAEINNFSHSISDETPAKGKKTRNHLKPSSKAAHVTNEAKGYVDQAKPNLCDEGSQQNKIAEFFRSFSSVSTPSEISHIVGVSLDIVQEVKSVKVPVPDRKSKKCVVLKDLAKSVNRMAETFEPLLHVKKWVDESPYPPDSALKKKVTTDSNASNKRKLLVEGNAPLPQEVTKALSVGNSFKEQISGIGDVSQLYEKILGRKSSIAEQQSKENFPALAAGDGVFTSLQQNLPSERCLPSVLSDGSSHFSDLQKVNTVPDPFNLVNTWKRKPLGLTVYDNKNHKNKDISSSMPLKILGENMSLEERYKSFLTSQSNSDVILSENNNTSRTSPTFSRTVEKPSFVSSMDESSLKNDESFEQLSSQNITSISHHSVGDVSQTSVSSRYSSQKEPVKSSHKSSHLSEKEPVKPLYVLEKEPLKSSHQSSHVSKKESVKYPLLKDDSSNGALKDDALLREHSAGNSSEPHLLVKEPPFDTVESSAQKSAEMSDELMEDGLAQSSSVVSEMLLSGTITSEYSIDPDMEETGKEVVPDRASRSGSSVSEIISVVENSKGFRSSKENIHPKSNGSPSTHSNVPVRSSANTESSIEEKVSSRSTKHETDSVASHNSNSDKIPSGSVHSSLSSEKSTKYSVIARENDQLQRIASDSQNSVSIDIRQPLRLTLSNESMHANEGLELHEEQYIHTRVVTRVASEAAAAAATSAVIAVFETQKALLSEKNYLGILNSYARPGSSKRTQYSSDFESSQAPKSSSSSSQSSAVVSKHSKSISEAISKNDKSGSVLSNGSIQEKITPEKTELNEDSLSKSPQSASIRTDINADFIPSQEYVIESQETPQRSKRKISGNVSSPSPASLSDNETVSSETIMSSHSNFSQQSESELSNDSFAQLTLDVVRRMTHEEELRARHQLSLLQFQEKTLVEKARAEMAWLEILKKKLREKGAERKVSSIKKKQKELIFRLRQERAQLRCMQEAYRSICEKHRSLLADKKRLLNEPNSLAFQLLNRDEKSHSSHFPEGKIKDLPKAKSTSSSTPTIVSDNDVKTPVDDESVSEVPEVFQGLASNSSQESVIDTQASEPAKTSNSSQNKSQQNSPNPSFSPLNTTQNPSLHSNHSLESALQGLKKLEASKRHLNKREQRILQRRKQVESLLQWQMKLDSEEMAVRELEQKALDLVDHSKKRAKYYVSSGSTNQDDDKRKDSIHESPVSSKASKLPSNSSKSSDDISPMLLTNGNGDKISNGNGDKISQSSPEENIPASGSRSDESIKTVKENGHQFTSSEHSSNSLPEEIKSGSGESSIQTVETTENGSQMEEAVPEEVSYHISPSSKEKSSSSDIYSESFESSVSRRTPFQSRRIKRNSEPGIRLPLVPRNVRRHDSSGSDDSYTISQSETASDQSDIEVRIHALAEELRRRKAEAEKLKKEHKKKYREQLKEKELSLQKQLEAYNQYIQQAKLELEHQIESAISPPQTSDSVVKPRIKWPRPEQVLDSRRVQKQTVVASDTFVLEKKTELVSSSPENSEISIAAPKDKGSPVIKKLFPDPPLKTDDESASKEISERSSLDSKDVSQVLSQISNDSSEIQEVSEIEQSQSVLTELSTDLKELSETNENSSSLSANLKKSEEMKPLDADLEHSLTVSSLDESKSSHGTLDSKSQTDTFVSDSASPKNSYLGSPKKTDYNTTSSRTVSSDEEIVKDIPGDIIRDSEHDEKVKSPETSSFEESISEVHSVINSASTEDLENEDENQHSSCGSSGGCEGSPALKLTDETFNVHEEKDKLSDTYIELNDKKLDTLTHIQSSRSVFEKDKQVLVPESKIVNIVDYLSTSLIDDTFRIFFDAGHQTGTIGAYQSRSNKVNYFVPERTNEKLVNTLSVSLLDAYLRDTFQSFFNILRDLKSDSRNLATPLFNSGNSKCDKQSIAFDSADKPPNGITNSFEKLEDGNQFNAKDAVPIQDVNDNEVFSKPSNLNNDNLVASQNEHPIQLLEQQLALQQYSYYYRKIPNKPPPPYTPPSLNASSFEFPFMKEKVIPKTFSVKEVTKNIDSVVDMIVESLLEGKRKGLALSEIPPTVDVIAETLELTVPHQMVFIDLVFDLTKEIILEQYNEREQEPRPWLRPQKLTRRPLFPSSKERMVKTIQKEVKKALKISDDGMGIHQRKPTLWSSMKLGRKKRDFVDTILISELKEEEPDWINYDQAEVTVKLQIADSIFNILINDTVKCFTDLQLKIKR